MSVYCCRALLSEIQINFVWGYHTCLSHLLRYIAQIVFHLALKIMDPLAAAIENPQHQQVFMF